MDVLVRDAENSDLQAIAGLIGELDLAGRVDRPRRRAPVRRSIAARTSRTGVRRGRARPRARARRAALARR